LNITWVAGWLPAIAAIAVLVFFRSKKLFVLLSVAAIIGVVLNMTYFNDAFLAEQTESGGTRLAAWIINWSVTGKHLLFGTGPAGYAAYYMSYYPTDAMATHNNYVDVIAQTGIVGLVVFLWMFASLALLGYQNCLRLKGRGDFLEAIGQASFAGTLSCIIAMAFGDWLLPFAYTQTIAGFDYAVYNWLFMGCILVLDRMIRTRPADFVRENS
jgi:O-antigen ligase